MSGAGKSVTVCDLLTQTEGYFGYTVIIEEGLCYGIYTATVEERAANHHSPGRRPDHQLPRHEGTAADAGPFVRRDRARRADDWHEPGEDKQMLRQAQIAKYLNLLYEDAFQDWCKKLQTSFSTSPGTPARCSNSAGADAARRDHPRNLCGLPRLEGEPRPTRRTTYLTQFDEAGAEVSQETPKTSKEVRNLAFAHFTPNEFPTHRMLQELMMLDPMGAERDQIMEIATLILPWCRDGNYGACSTARANLSLTGKIAHFELGYIPESAKELKAAAGFLITNHAANTS